MNESDTSAGLDRREMLSLGLGAFVLGMCPLALTGGPRLVRRRIPIMGTVGEVAVVHPDPATAHAAIDAAFAALRQVDACMSRFRPDSDVGRANRLAAHGSVRIGGDTAHVVEHALRWASATDGRFDPCLGHAVELWDVKRQKAPPSGAAAASMAGRRLFSALVLDRDTTGGAVRFDEPDVALDLGGIAKGHAVDRAVAALRAAGVEQAFVNVGGDLFALGRSEDGDPWRVGVRDPEDPLRIARTVHVADEAIATSGDYAQYFVHAGRRYHHLLDPSTGAPRVGQVHALTIAATTCLAADAAATACFGLTPATAAVRLRGIDGSVRVL